MPDKSIDGYILEFYPVGNVVKVSAVDTETGTEVSIMGPATAPREQLQKLAIQKLEFILKKGSAD